MLKQLPAHVFSHLLLMASGYFMLAGCQSKPAQPQPSSSPRPLAAAPDSLAKPDTTRQETFTIAEIQTRLGVMKVKLYDNTPRHKAQFIQLAKSGFYDGTFFHRAIQGLMIQGGDANSKNNDPQDDGLGHAETQIPQEISPENIHKRGAVCAVALPETPDRSTGTQFYIIQGGDPISARILADQQDQVRMLTGKSNFTYTTEARRTYRAVGGAPWLDLQYTCFGEVVEGLSVLDRLAGLDTPRKLGEATEDPMLMDRPQNLRNTRMTIRIIEPAPVPDGTKNSVAANHNGVSVKR